MSIRVIIKGSEIVEMRMRPVITLVEDEKDGLLREMSKVTKEIHQLRVAVDQVDVSPSDSTNFDRICIRLDAAEQEYFLLFNQYRVACGHKPLEGKKFTGSHYRYESVLF